MPEERPRVRAVRRDALVNHDRLLQAALDLLATDGERLSLKSMAARAGLGVGTAYRHFSTVDDVIRALYDNMTAVLAGRIAEVSDDQNAWTYLVNMMETFTFAVADTPAFRAVMRRIYLIDPSYAPAGALVPRVREIVERAQAEGDLRPDITAGDLVLIPLMLGTFTGDPNEKERTMLQRYLRVMFDGLRAEGPRSELPARDMTPFEVHQFTHRPAARRDP